MFDNHSISFKNKLIISQIVVLALISSLFIYASLSVFKQEYSQMIEQKSKNMIKLLETSSYSSIWSC